MEAVDDGRMRVVLFSKQQRKKNPTSRIPEAWSFIAILNRREDTGDETAWPHGRPLKLETIKIDSIKALYSFAQSSTGLNFFLMALNPAFYLYNYLLVEIKC